MDWAVHGSLDQGIAVLMRGRLLFANQSRGALAG
jgi:hypothetical protein